MSKQPRKYGFILCLFMLFSCGMIFSKIITFNIKYDFTSASIQQSSVHDAKGTVTYLSSYKTDFDHMCPDGSGR